MSYNPVRYMNDVMALPALAKQFYHAWADRKFYAAERDACVELVRLWTPVVGPMEYSTAYELVLARAAGNVLMSVQGLASFDTVLAYYHLWYLAKMVLLTLATLNFYFLAMFAVYIR